MTDEMTIQQRRSPLVPTVLGAGAGSVIGYGVGHWMTKPMTHEDIIKDINDTTTFSNRVKEGAPEAATWQEVKNKADEVAKLKGALEEAKLGELKDTNLADDIAKTEKEIEDKIADLTKEKTVTKKTGSSIVPAGENWRMTPKERNEYTRLYNDWKAAVDAFEIRPDVVKLTNDIANRKLEYSMFYDEIVTDASNEIKNTASKKPNKRIKNFAEYLEKGNGEDFISEGIKKNKFHHLTNEELIRHAGGEKKLSATKPSSGLFKSQTAIEVTKADGTKAWAVFEDKELKNLKKQKADRIFKDITETLEAYSKNKNKLDNLHENVKFDKDVLNRAGIVQKTQNGVKGFVYYNKANKNQIVFKDFVEDCCTNAKTYADDARVLFDNGVHNAKKPVGATSVTYASDVQNILTKYNATSPKELYEELVAKQSIGNKYTAEKATVEKSIHEILARDTQLASLEGQMSTLRNGAKNVRNLEQQIKGRYGSFLNKSGATTETVAGLTREQAIEKLGKTYTDLDDKLKGLKEKAKTAERKAADPAKVKAAQDAVDAGEKSLKEMAESLGKKITKGPNKLVAALIGAAALGLTTLLVVNSKNNKAQA